MAKLCDPDINMIIMPGCVVPETSIREMVVDYYRRHGPWPDRADQYAAEYINANDEICQLSLADGEPKA